MWNEKFKIHGCSLNAGPQGLKREQEKRARERTRRQCSSQQNPFIDSSIGSLPALHQTHCSCVCVCSWESSFMIWHQKFSHSGCSALLSLEIRDKFSVEVSLTHCFDMILLCLCGVCVCLSGYLKSPTLCQSNSLTEQQGNSPPPSHQRSYDRVLSINIQLEKPSNKSVTVAC